MNTIESIRKAGNKVRVCHSRLLINHGKTLYPLHEIREKNLQHIIRSTGGRTVLAVTTPDGKDFTAEAICSRHDHFNRHTALAIAIGRLQKIMYGAA